MGGHVGLLHRARAADVGNVQRDAGDQLTHALMVRPVGMASSVSRLSTCDFVVLWTSTIGDVPVTVSVSCEGTDLQVGIDGHREVGRQLEAFTFDG